MYLLKPYNPLGIRNLSCGVLPSLLFISLAAFLAFLACLQQTSAPQE